MIDKHSVRLASSCCYLALLGGCTEVVESDGVTTLGFRTSTILTVAVAGIALVALGILLLLKVLPKRMGALEGRPLKRIRAFLAFVSIPVFGVLLLVAVIPFWWYRVEVSENELAIREFPSRHEFRRGDVQSLHRIDDGSRIRIRMASGEEFFINSSEVGSDGFAQIGDALDRFMSAPSG